MTRRHGQEADIQGSRRRLHKNNNVLHASSDRIMLEESQHGLCEIQGRRSWAQAPALEDLEQEVGASQAGCRWGLVGPRSM